MLACFFAAGLAKYSFNDVNMVVRTEMAGFGSVYLRASRSATGHYDGTGGCRSV